LVNLKGELIGINTAIIGPAGGNVGIGFAIPSNMARAVMAQLRRFGELRRGVFGAATQDLTPELGKVLKVRAKEGAAVVEVSLGSAADKAGLRPSDVVVAINGRPVRGALDLRNQLGLVPVGEDVELRIQHEGSERTVKVVLEPVQPRRGSGQLVAELSGAAFTNVERDRNAGGK
jgi:S1-C subfamily serine protease